MKQHYFLVSAVVFGLSVLMPLAPQTVSAATINVGPRLVGSGTSTTGVSAAGVHVNSSVGATTNVSGTATSSVNINTGVNAGTNINSTSNATNANNGANTATGNTVENGVDISTTLATPVQVQSDADLTAYTKMVEQNDSSVSAVTTSDNTVSVKYKVPAKLFGFIPASVTETASVAVGSDSNTSVSVTPPWWAMFYKIDSRANSFSSDINAYVPENVSLSATATGSAGAALNPSAKAQLISAIDAGAKQTFYSN